MALSRAMAQLALSLKSHVAKMVNDSPAPSSSRADLRITNAFPLANWRRGPDPLMAVVVGMAPNSEAAHRVPFLAYGAGSLLVSSARESSESAQLAALVSGLCQWAMSKGISVKASLKDESLAGEHPKDAITLLAHTVLKTRLEAQQLGVEIESEWKTMDEASRKEQPDAKYTTVSVFSWDATVAISQGKTVTRILVKDGVGFPEPGTSYQAALDALIDAMDALGAKVQWLETEIVNGAPAVTALISPPSGAGKN
jgi:hypothetical protein